MANEQNLIPMSERSSREKQQMRSNGGKKSGEVRRAKKTFAEIVQDWADREPSDVDKAKLAKLGIVGEQATNKMMLLVPLLANVSSGNTKALEMVVQLLSEDKEKNKRIEKLESEIALLKAQTEKLESEKTALSDEKSALDKLVETIKQGATE